MLESHLEAVLEANEKDITEAEKVGLSAALVDRLRLTKARVLSICRAVREIAKQPAVVNQVVSEKRREDGLIVCKETIPLGVIGFIFESRPNVCVDASALAIKSGNAIILKGGKEAFHSNQILFELIQKAITGILPESCIVLVDSNDRDSVKRMLSLRDEIDVVIPRGGESLVNFVYQEASMPVIAHFKGLCHIYVNQDADRSKALDICLNAKVQRPSVCNAVETILLDRNLDDEFVQLLVKKLQESGVEVRTGPNLTAVVANTTPASDDDWQTEYLDKVVSIKFVDGVDGAVNHINRFGSHHTESILAKDKTIIDSFRRRIDASCVIVNASTRFNDGGELGLGAEIGISTTKIHSYGPMGAAEMTAQRFFLVGDGHVRADS